MEKDEILSNDLDVAETMNKFFSQVVDNLEINGYNTNDFLPDTNLDDISNIIIKFKNHPSILKINENMNVCEPFQFSFKSNTEISEEVKKLNRKNLLHSILFQLKFL